MVNAPHMRIKLPLRYILNPSTVVFLTALMSAIAWSIPDYDIFRKGFTNRVDLSFYSFFIIFSWYIFICCFFYLGQRIGAVASSIIHVDSTVFDINNFKYLYLYSFLATVGVIFTYYKILSDLPLALIFQCILNNQANQIKESLYNNYSAGIMSLRYLVVFSSSLAASQYFKRKKFSTLLILNMLLLISVTFISARLLLVATLLNTIFITSYFKKNLQLKIFKGAFIILFFFFVLSILNFTRNADYYEMRGLSFWGAGLSEIITYLGAPFQVSIRSAEVIDNVTNVPAGTYRFYVDIESNLTTNSSFVHLHEQLGYAAWLYISVLSLFFGFLFSFFVGFGRTIFMLSSGAILYAAAELWRLNLFQQGIFITWFVCSISLPIISNPRYLLSKFIKL